MGIGDALLLAVSGGADSMALLNGAVQLCQTNQQQITVAHINHGLRGPESDADAALVRRSSERLGCRFELKTLKPGELADHAKGSLEEAARNTRYEWLSETATNSGIEFVATAHHAEDQAETVLHNLIRGTGLRGLGGMQPSRPLGEGVSLIRPMMNLQRSEIDCFLQQQQIDFRQDKSNSDPRFTRNRIRTKLLPDLKDSFNPQVVKNLNSLSNIANETADCIDQIANRVLQEAVLHADEQGCRLNTNAFAEWPNIVVRQSLMLVWTRLGWPRQKMTYRHWLRLAEIAIGEPDASAQFPGGISVNRTQTLMRMARTAHE